MGGGCSHPKQRLVTWSSLMRILQMSLQALALVTLKSQWKTHVHYCLPHPQESGLQTPHPIAPAQAIPSQGPPHDSAPTFLGRDLEQGTSSGQIPTSLPNLLAHSSPSVASPPGGNGVVTQPSHHHGSTSIVIILGLVLLRSLSLSNSPSLLQASA